MLRVLLNGVGAANKEAVKWCSVFLVPHVGITARDSK